jgi:hypothetical protein
MFLRVEEARLHGTMMFGRIVFGRIIIQIGATRCPIDLEVALSGTFRSKCFRSMPMNNALGVEMTLLKSILAMVSPAALVLTSPG